MFEAVTFHDFNNVEIKGCSSRQYCMGPNTHASDNIHIQNFKNTVFDNVHDDAVAHIYEPPSGWANPTDCGNFPCTAPQNAVLKFTGTTFKGTAKPSFADAVFQIVGNYKSIPSDTCVKKLSWNAYFCKNTKQDSS